MTNDQPNIAAEDSKRIRTAEECLSQMRLKLLDPSLHNTLLNYKERKHGIKIIDELPNVTFKYLVSDQKEMTLLPLSEQQSERIKVNNEVLSPEESFVISTILKKGGSEKTINTVESNLDKDFREKFKKDSINTLLKLKFSNIITLDSADIGLIIKLVAESDVATRVSFEEALNQLSDNAIGEEPRHFDLNLQTALVSAQLEKRCSKLRLDTRIALDETGCNFLYLNIGFLKWYESEDSEIELKAPLILIPLALERTKIKRKTDYFTYKVSHTGEDVLTNVSLAEKLKRAFGIELPSYGKSNGADEAGADEIEPEQYLKAVEEVISQKRRWSVAREMIISTFSFFKVVMYEDLDPRNWPSHASLINNKLVNVLCTGPQDESGSAIVPGSTEKTTPSFDYSLILDADSSQMHAIGQVLKGTNYVIHGPPGTGKSQTISNLIACALHMGKSVLFVAEKKAALEVVKKRLDYAGLGDLCLELHSHKIRKDQVFGDIIRRLNLKTSFDSQELERCITRLQGFKSKLSSYVREMNRKISPIEKTVHDIIWAAETYRKDGYDKLLQPLASANGLTQDDIDSNTDTLASIAALYEELTRHNVKNWQWFSSKNIMPGDSEKVHTLVKQLKELLDSSISYYRAANDKYGLPFDFSFPSIEKFVQLRSMLSEIDEYVLLTQKILYFCYPKYWKLRSSLNRFVSSSFESNPLRKKRASKDFSRLTKRVKPKAAEQDILKFYNFLLSLKSPRDLVSWCFDIPTADRLDALRNTAEYSFTFFSKFAELTESLQNYGEIESKPFTDAVTGRQSIRTLSGLLAESLKSINILPRWSEYCRLSRKAEQRGLAYYVSLLNDGMISSTDLITLYRYNVYSELSRSLIKNQPFLAEFSRNEHEQARSIFKTLDKQILEMTANKVVAEVVESCQPPRGIMGARVREYTEMCLINHEIRNQRRHIPIRQLVKRAGRALKALKPCFMMSPMSVAQFLPPGDLEFDLVVMDEASQIFPEDALGAIARAKSMVVVGDPKQLPPTSFFTGNIFADGDDDGLFGPVAAESILDRSDELFESSRLQWHYRSYHESLINFSNREFYDNELIVFPSPYTNNADYGASSHFVPKATYLKGRNMKEAEAVVNKIIEHYETSPNLSLGVVTFNIRQRDLIQELLDRVTKENPYLDEVISSSNNELEPFFIKNLENVQGDERDAIIISTTFGPDPETGKVYQRFGPIGGEFGWRRLNVMVTRAKRKVLVVTSMKPDDILDDPNRSRGVRALKNYIQYAEDGRFIEDGSITGHEPQSDFEVAVIRELNNLGYKCSPQVGVAGYFIDIGVLHPKTNDFVLGVECDGATYHSAKNDRDRDRLRQEILEAKGWKIHRIWSTDWFRNREHEIGRLKSVLEKLVQESASKSVAAATSDAESAETTLFDFTMSRSDDNLRKELEEYRNLTILPKSPDIERCILRDDMLEAFIKVKPTTADEFRQKLPLNLREKTDPGQMEFLDDILEIIEDFE
jgi:very-short-patch-repair endonuclease